MLHKNIPLGDIHYIHNWEVADAANRLALVVTFADRGKLCWQLDTNEFFFLASASPLLWLPAIGIQGPQGVKGDPGNNGVNAPKVLPIACSDEITALTTGTKVTFRMPYAMTVSSIKASLTTAQASGNTVAVDVRHNGSSVFSTLLSIDNTEKTSVTASIPAVVSLTSLNDDAEMLVNITQLGDGTARGLKVYIIGS